MKAAFLCRVVEAEVVSNLKSVEALIFFRLLRSNCLNWKFTAIITLRHLLFEESIAEFFINFQVTE